MLTLQAGASGSLPQSQFHHEDSKTVVSSSISRLPLDKKPAEWASPGDSGPYEPRTVPYESHIIEHDGTLDKHIQSSKAPFPIDNEKLQPPTGSDPSSALAMKVLQIIGSYRVDFESTGSCWDKISGFLPLVTAFVQRDDPVRMVLPAFPFKSPNSVDKVLGVLPDLGEELALAHLDGLCKNIRQVYKPGAEVHISSDGLVYNDLLGVSDEAVWNYGEALRRMAIDKEFHHIRFIRLIDLLDHPIPLSSNDDAARAYYLAHASCLRRELEFRFGNPGFDVHQSIKNDEDVCRTYRGYLKFLTKDMAPQLSSKSKREKTASISHVARSMIVRGQMFAAAVRANRGDYIRLSIHDSNSGHKVPVSLIPQARGLIGLTPWHSCVAVDLNGVYRPVHTEDVRHTHDLIYKDGQPYYFRERSELFDWSKDGLLARFEHLYPCGLLICPLDDTKPPPSIRAIPMRKVRTLSHSFSPIVLRGFESIVEEEPFVELAKELGTILPWSFGIVQKVRDTKRTDKMGNNVTSNEAMPMHFDGMFKVEEHSDPITGEIVRVQKPPHYQIFTCLAAAPKGDGHTLFASSRLLFRYLPMPWTSERLQRATWAMNNDGFWDAKMKNLPLVVTHPETGLPCVRWHQPWDSTKTRFSTCEVWVENEDFTLRDQLDSLTYDYRVCRRLSWETGDILVNDNIGMLHTRTSYRCDCDRELWRIHCD
ncbi:hypothetical protein N7513_006177 [Penicillium frequentans]|nr:hypothetical protein N7513_006177 [Penicillium glabrum]